MPIKIIKFGMDDNTSSTTPSPTTIIKPARAQHWTGTINNYTQRDVGQLTDIKEHCSYYVAGQEVGEQGTPHLQCYFYFKKQQYLSTLKRWFPTGHFEVKYVKSSPAQAAEYCKKDGEFIEFGILPQSQSVAGGKATADKWSQTKELAKAGNLDAIDAKILITHYKNIKQLHYDHTVNNTRLISLQNEWIWGPPGVGKSYSVRERYPNLYLKMCNKWWDGYNNEEVVLLDDFDKSHYVLGHHLKIWADLYPFRAEVKNFSSVIRPKRIIITSNYSIEEIFGNDKEMCTALKRRFQTRKIEKIVTFDDSKPARVKQKEKKRKHDQIRMKPALYRQNAEGKIVQNQNKQPTLQSLVDAATQIEISNDDSEESIKLISYTASSTSSSSSEE